MISSQTILEELCSTGSSGSLLYYTRDGEFIVKTISKNEFKFLKTMIGKYFFYLKDNPLSFLPKLLGAYVLKRKYKKNSTNRNVQGLSESRPRYDRTQSDDDQRRNEILVPSLLAQRGWLLRRLRRSDL